MQRCSSTVEPYTQARASPNSPQPSASHGLQPVLRPHTPFPQAIDQRFPRLFAFTVGHLPVQDLAFAAAIGPEAKGDQQHHLLACSLMTLALTFVQLDGVRLALHAQPNAIELDASRDIGDGFAVRLPKERFDLIDAFVDRA